jgi:uncharacterized membrane protein
LDRFEISKDGRQLQCSCLLKYRFYRQSYPGGILVIFCSFKFLLLQGNRADWQLMDQNGTGKKAVTWFWITTYTLAVIGIAIAIRRLLITGGIVSSGGNRGPDFDSGSHVPSVLTLLHVIPGLVFMILGPLQFIKGIRHNYIRLHRYSGWTFIVAVYVIGLSALLMPLISMPLGGISEAAGSLFFALFFLFAATKALLHILKKQTDLHREWMLRTFATGLAIATVRPIMALAFAIVGLTPQEFLGTAFWIGFTVHLIGAEAWINYTRQERSRGARAKVQILNQ